MANTILEVFLAGAGSGDAAGIDYDNSGSGLTATNVQDAIDELAVDYFKPLALVTLAPGDITAGFITLAATPSTPTLTRLTAGAIRHTYGIDFTVSGSTLSWSGLGLDGILESGDILQIEIK